jgi:carbon monoxide dehydrogenase subunit G
MRSTTRFMAVLALLLSSLPTSEARPTSDSIASGARGTENELAVVDAPPTREMRIERQDNQVRVHAQSDVEVDRATIWSTLSDYDHLAQFIPNMSSSRTISRDGPNVLVEQRATAGLGPIRRSFTVTFAVMERLNESISISQRAGDFSRFDARYEIVPLARDRSRVVYDATIVPLSSSPSLVIDVALRLMIANQFDALIHEIERRAQVSAIAPSPRE